MEFAVIELPALSEDGIAVRMDTAFGPAGVLQFSYVTAYVADGDRLLVLELSGGTAAVEREMARFEGLLRAAYEYQHDALG